DLLGTSLGVSYLFNVSENIVAPILGVIILLLALSGGYKVIEKLMIILIIIMGITFITTMFVAGPDNLELLKGSFVSGIPCGSILLVIALIVTTVDYYNFFILAL